MLGCAEVFDRDEEINLERMMDLYARVELWKSIDPDPEFCRKAEREMLLLSCQDPGWIQARMREFELALADFQRRGLQAAE